MSKILAMVFVLASLLFSNAWAVEKAAESPSPAEDPKLTDGEYLCRCPHLSVPRGIKMPEGDSSQYKGCLKDFQFSVKEGVLKIGNYQGGEKPSAAGPLMITWLLSQPMDGEAEHATTLTVTVPRSFLKDGAGFFFVKDASGGGVTHNFLYCARK